MSVGSIREGIARRALSRLGSSLFGSLAREEPGKARVALAPGHIQRSGSAVVADIDVGTVFEERLGGSLVAPCHGSMQGRASLGILYVGRDSLLDKRLNGRDLAAICRIEKPRA